MTPDGLPPTIPVFPLTGALLLPYGQLPLNIFEPRYVALAEDALGANRFMGMIQPQGTERETVGDDSPLFGIGCLGRITEFADPGDGRYEIVLTGVCRFKIARELDTRPKAQQYPRQEKVDRSSHQGILCRKNRPTWRQKHSGGYRSSNRL